MLAIGSAACGHHAHQKGDVPVITATGEGRASGKPDRAVVTVAAITEAKDAASAAEESARVQGDVIAALKKLIGDGGSVKTSGYSLNPMYDFENNRQTLRGYQVRNAITAELRDTKLVGPVIDAAVKAGASEVSSIGFEVRENAELRAKAIAEASAAAVREATAAAQSLGLRAGEVRTVSVASTSGGNPPMPMAKGRMMESAQMDTPVEPGTVEVHATVSVEVRLEKR